MPNIDMISFLQGICTLLIFLEYGGQIFKLWKVKSVKSLSFTYWATKITISVLQLVILVMACNPLKAYLSQILSLFFCMIVFSMMVFYDQKKKKKKKQKKK